MSDGFLGVLRHEGFEFGLGLLMLKESRSGEPEAAGEFRPGVGETHVGDRTASIRGRGWLDPEKVRGLARPESRLLKAMTSPHTSAESGASVSPTEAIPSVAKSEALKAPYV